MISETFKNLTAVAQTIPMNVSMFNTAVFSAKVVGSVNSHNVTFEFSNDSMDGSDGTWLVLPCIRIATTPTSESVSGVLNATPTYAWRSNVTSIVWVRARVATHTSGTMAWQITASDAAATDSQGVLVSGPVTGTVTANVVGQAAHDAVISGNPVRVAGRSVTTNYAVTAAGDVADLATTLTGAAIVKENAPYGAQWRASGTLTTTADLVLKTASGTGVFNALTDLILQNTNAVATIVNIKDGSTTIGQVSLPATMAAPVIINLKTPLLSTANAALNIAAVTTGANVLVTASGFSGA